MPSTGQKMVEYVIFLTVSAFLTGYLLPPAITAIANATTKTWNPAVVTIFQVLLPILIIIGLALAFMPEELREKL
jgi:hypothetical protein